MIRPSDHEDPPMSIRLSRLRRFPFTLLALPFLLSCGGRPAAPNILLVVIDTMRADHLGCYGYGRPTSPAIDRIAAEGVRYENAYTSAPWTLPAVASLMTGTRPWEHGAVNDYLAPRPDLSTLGGLLGEAGYETAAFVSHIYTSRVYGFDAGFDRFEDFRIAEGYVFDQGLEPRAERVIGEAVRWLEGRDRSKPFFLWIHLFDPHWEYGAPEPYRAMFDPDYDGPVDGTYRTIERYLEHDSLMAPRDLEHLIALYDGEVRYADAWIDTLVRRLEKSGDWGRTVAVVTGDHGEEFQEHRSLGHSFTFYDEVLRVPLVFRDPEGPAGAELRTPVGLVDIFPTLLSRAGAPSPEGISGRELPANEDLRSRHLAAGTTREGQYGRALVEGRRKIVWDREGTRLYHRGSDPAETVDLLAGGAEFPELMDALFPAPSDTGWVIAWDACGRGPREWAGAVEASGIVVEVLPLRGAEIAVEAANNRGFRFVSRAAGSGGLRFRTVPPDGPVRFSLTIDGRPGKGSIAVGREGFAPPAPSFGLDPASSPAGTFAMPDLSPPFDGYRVWKGSDPPPPPRIDLTAEEEARLRALGYVR
ncbi:MAG: sulfatase [Candidatus Eisenbacteria bacterium]